MLDLSFWAFLPAQLGDVELSRELYGIQSTIAELQSEVASVKTDKPEIIEWSEYRLDCIVERLFTEKHRLLYKSVQFGLIRLTSAKRALMCDEASVNLPRCQKLVLICNSLVVQIQKDLKEADSDEAEWLRILVNECLDLLQYLGTNSDSIAQARVEFGLVRIS